MFTSSENVFRSVYTTLMDVLRFPDEFLWGASTSAHQVEGGLVNSWTAWEQSAVRMRELEQSGLAERYGLANFVSGRAADHFHRFREDFALAKRLGHTATRLSLEWSRIEPKEGQFDRAALRHYQTVIRYVRSLDMEPFVTLWHWPVPIWLEQQGGWAAPGIVDRFEHYVAAVAEALGKDVQHWITLNEPEIFAGNSYLSGVWPPQQRQPLTYLRVLNHLVAAHRRAYAVLKATCPNCLVGIATNNACIEVGIREPVHLAVRALADYWNNHWFLDRIRSTQDFIGLNYYFHNRIAFGFNKNANDRVSDLGWELHPDGIEPVLMGLRRYQVPVYITEHGLADAADSQRAWYIVRSLQAVHQAIRRGVDVRGYLHWSLIDNFEWDKGFWPRFGLIEVNYATQQRTIRPSALVLRQIARLNGISSDLRERYTKEEAR